jgi:hypothetical protein
MYAEFFLDHRITLALEDEANTSDWNGTFTAYVNAYGDVISGTDATSGRRLPDSQATTVRYPWGGASNQTTFTNNMTQWINFTKNHTFSQSTDTWFKRTYHYGATQPDEPDMKCDLWAADVNQGTWARAIDTNMPLMVTGNWSDYHDCTSDSPAINILTPLMDFLDVKSGSDAATRPQSPSTCPTCGPLSVENDRIDYNSFSTASPVNAVWG